MKSIGAKFYHPDKRIGQGKNYWEAMKEVLGSDISVSYYLDETYLYWYSEDPTNKVWKGDITNPWMDIKQGYIEEIFE